MNFEITVKDLPARRLAGMVIRTNMQQASVDCPAIWQAFGPRMAEFSGRGEAYGVSVMLSADGTFDYWAAVEIQADAAVPEGLTAVDLPGGLYAIAEAPNLEQISAVYGFMYMEWPRQQSEYAVNMAAPCVEVYRGEWQPSDAIEVWVPVKVAGDQ